jgi:hypothetical protein
LEHFFKHLHKNYSQRYEDQFPFISTCRGEHNYLKCEDLPYVVTHLDENNNMIQLNQIKSAHWLFHFEPELLHYNPNNGRLYYLFENKEIIRNNNTGKNDPRRLKHLDNMPCAIALVKSDLNIQLMSKTRKVTENDSNGKEREVYLFEYKGKTYKLSTMNDADPCKHIRKHSQHGDEL